jgi:hypothetical protein
LTARQPAGHYSGRSGRAERRCVLFGCLEAAAWIVGDPQGGELSACEADLDVILNDALARVSPASRVRVEVWACLNLTAESP